MKWCRGQKREAPLPAHTYLPYYSYSKHWALYVLRKDAASEFTLQCFLPRHVDAKAFENTTDYLVKHFETGEPEVTYSEDTELGDCTLFWFLYSALLQQPLEETLDVTRQFLSSCQQLLRDLLQEASVRQEEDCESLFLHNSDLETRFETLFSGPCGIAGGIPSVFTAYTPLPQDSAQKKARLLLQELRSAKSSVTTTSQKAAKGRTGTPKSNFAGPGKEAPSSSFQLGPLSVGQPSRKRQLPAAATVPEAPVPLLTDDAPSLPDEPRSPAAVLPRPRNLLKRQRISASLVWFDVFAITPELYLVSEPQCFL